MRSGRGLMRLAEPVTTLPPASFAFVMASAITALGFKLLGREVLATILICAAIAGALILVVATSWRLLAHRDKVIADANNPAKTFGFFTIVAAGNVLGAYFAMSGYFPVAAVLSILSALLWLLLTYALPGSVVLGHGNRPVMSEINGSWFLWVVGTQSVATAAAIAGGHVAPEVLSTVAVGMWGVGVALYLLVATLVTLRMLLYENAPTSLSPTYWIYMGATAITVLAGSRILLLPSELQVMQATASFVSGLSYVLWALGLWWIPLLVIFGLWRHLVRRVPLKYEAALWSIVFPLGMYSVASMLYGGTQDLDFMVRFGQSGIWIAGLIWALSTAAMLLTAVRWLRAGSADATGGTDSTEEHSAAGNP